MNRSPNEKAMSMARLVVAALAIECLLEKKVHTKSMLNAKPTLFVYLLENLVHAFVRIAMCVTRE